MCMCGLLAKMLILLSSLLAFREAHWLIYGYWCSRDVTHLPYMSRGFFHISALSLLKYFLPCVLIPCLVSSCGCLILDLRTGLRLHIQFLRFLFIYSLQLVHYYFSSVCASQRMWLVWQRSKRNFSLFTICNLSAFAHIIRLLNLTGLLR